MTSISQTQKSVTQRDVELYLSFEFSCRFFEIFIDCLEVAIRLLDKEQVVCGDGTSEDLGSRLEYKKFQRIF